MKLSGNFLIAAVIESLGEAMALVAKAGVDKNDYLEILTSTLFGAPVYKTYGGLIAREEFEPAGFAAELGAKDVRLALAAGEALQTPLPIASLLRDRFLTLLANGGAGLDWSARRAARLGGRRTEPYRSGLAHGAGRPVAFGDEAVVEFAFGVDAFGVGLWARVRVRRGIARPRLGSSVTTAAIG